MTGIAIIGCGIQARKHVHCYGKLKERCGITINAIIDPNPQSRNLCLQTASMAGFPIEEIREFDSIEQCPEELFSPGTVTDIATPNKFHYAAAAAAESKGAGYLVVEKPLAHTLEEANKFLSLKSTVFALENYLFSAVTRGVVDYLRLRDLKPIFLKSEFSKDRRLDSLNGRGAHSGYVPHVFTIEIPHQIAIANSILGSPGIVCDAWHHDMILPDGRLCNHGEGAITMVHDGVPSYNFSCLQGYRHMPMNYRSVRVFCSNGYKLLGFYSTSLEQDSSMIVYKNNRIEDQFVFHDDSLTFALEIAITGSRDNSQPSNDAQYGVDVMKIIEAARRIAKKSI